MADRGADLAALPKEVKDQLAELELELSEGNRGDGWFNPEPRLAHYRRRRALHRMYGSPPCSALGV